MRTTPTQKRAIRAQALLDSGMDPKAAAKECGYKNVNGMMGAIALCLRKMPDEDREAELERMREAETRREEQERSLPQSALRQTAPSSEGAKETGEEDAEFVSGYYELDGETVLVGERMNPQEAEDYRTRREEARIGRAYDAAARYRQRVSGADGARMQTKRCAVELGTNEEGVTSLRMHIYGIDQWLRVEERLVGGREELLRICRDLRAGLDAVIACGGGEQA